MLENLLEDRVVGEGDAHCLLAVDGTLSAGDRTENEAGIWNGESHRVVAVAVVSMVAVVRLE